MSASGVALHGFAFGEHLEGVPQRSLGYRLLAPAEPVPWTAEVESLARRLQAAPYPDHWPPADLFCSVLLADGQRLIASARYGLADHTSSHRRSGLELIGVLAPGNLGVPTALALYRWLCQRRAETDDLRSLGGHYPLAELLSTVSAVPAKGDPLPILPIRLWEHGALLFAATSPSDPDHYLGLLEDGAGGAWQWLPLVGADFPLLMYGQRGPLVAWTPHLAGVAVKLDSKLIENSTASASRRRLLPTVFGVAALLLLSANLGAIYSLYQRLPQSTPASAAAEPSQTTLPPQRSGADTDREKFAEALYGLVKQPGTPNWPPSKVREVYQHLAKKDERLRVSSPEGQALVAAVSQLARRDRGQVETWVRDALRNKGYDPELIELVCRRIHERLTMEAREQP
jgi:hypothetical protein